jgi:hypothetical protein
MSAASPVEATITRLREHLPEELHRLQAFLCWQKQPKRGKPGKFDKIPYYTHGRKRCGANGSPEDRAQLVDLEAALAAFRRTHYFDGIGMALLAELPVWALDLDDCIDERGNLSTLAQRAVASNTYTERSPSGQGVRALFAGKAGVDAKNHDAGVEVFDSRGFVTLTADRIGGERLLPGPTPLLADLIAIVHAGPAGSPRGAHALPDTPPENPALVDGVEIPSWLLRRLVNPYPPGADRSAVAFHLALDLRREGVSAERAMELMCIDEVIAPALERRGGDPQAARSWMWRYCVAPAYFRETPV